MGIPKHKCRKLNFQPFNNSNDIFGKTLVGTRLNMYIVVFKASIYKDSCRLKLLSILRTMFNNALQDFTVLPTAKFRRCVIRSSSVIFLPTSSPTDYIRRLSLCRWFPIPSLYRSEKQKNHLPMVLQMEFARKKKRFPLEIYRRIFSPSIYCDLLTDSFRR